MDWLHFHLEEGRRCEFFHEDRSAGPRGLAFAVVLRALEDGVCEQWLRLLARFYEVPIPKKAQPARRVRMDAETKQLSGRARPKIVLTWLDTAPISQKHLTAVA